MWILVVVDVSLYAFIYLFTQVRFCGRGINLDVNTSVHCGLEFQIG